MVQPRPVGTLHRRAWNETGARRERRQLKHRAVEEIRPVPISPALARMLRDHLSEYGTAPDGRLFRGEGGDLLSDTVCTRTWEKARRLPIPGRGRLTACRTPLRPAPRPPVHLAQRRRRPRPGRRMAGNSVPVLLRVYAKCLTDSEQTALRRIEERGRLAQARSKYAD